jgi:2-polyprenyl-6-methoxyphenol hydroxylase-like FAD-dependent oxidoreductase
VVAETHAVVIGGSLAGLCAARVLADAFDRVTVVERDALPHGPIERGGAPQARHVHAMLMRGQRELDALFPGFSADVEAGGGLSLDLGCTLAQLRMQGWIEPYATNMPVLCASRALYESVVREKVRAEPRIAIADRTEVSGLLSAGARVAGVSLRPRDGGPARDLAADFVVDAAGRSSKAPAWLEALGFTPPDETLVDSRAGYATRWYAFDEGSWPREWWWRGAWIDPRMDEPLRAAVLMPVEGNRFIVTIVGFPGTYPPGDADGFEAELWKQRSPIVAEAVKLARPLGDVYAHRAMSNRYRHFERARELPAGFVVIGDALCAFNPVYGQGMTSAVLAAQTLGRCLRGADARSSELPRLAYRELERVMRGVWNMATGADWGVPFTVGDRPRGAAFAGRYMQALGELVKHDFAARKLLLEVMHLLRPAEALFAPGIAARVARSALRAWWRGAQPGVDSRYPPPLPAGPLPALP